MIKTRRTLLPFTALAVLLLSSCATGGTTSTSDESGGGGGLSGSCGTATTVPVDDPDGVVAQFSEDSAALYNGYTDTVRASAWKDWKPDGDGPYKVGIAFAALNNPYQASMLEAIESTLKASPEISDVTTVVATNTDVTAQLQQYQALVQQGVDLIIYQPNAADAFVDPVDEAAADGIPSVAVQTSVPTANSVNVKPNSYASAVEATNAVLKNLNGTGSILGVHGVPGIPSDDASFDGFNDAISQCPDAKMIGEVTGGFDPSAAKSEILQFLSTYTGDVDAVVQTAVMAPGIISAFEESGLPVPAVTDIAAQQGSLAFWNENRDSYKGVGVGQSPTGTGTAIAQIALNMLAGDGLKVSDVVLQGTLITDENLDDWVDASWTMSSIGTADGPSGLSPISNAYMQEIFTTQN